MYFDLFIGVRLILSELFWLMFLFFEVFIFFLEFIFWNVFGDFSFKRLDGCNEIVGLKLLIEDWFKLFLL